MQNIKNMVLTENDAIIEAERKMLEGLYPVPTSKRSELQEMLIEPETY